MGGTGQAQPQLWQLWHWLTGMGRKRKERCQCKTEDKTLHDCAQAAAETTGLSQKAGLLPVHSALQSKNGHLGGVAEDDITKNTLEIWTGSVNPLYIILSIPAQMSNLMYQTSTSVAMTTPKMGYVTAH